MLTMNIGTENDGVGFSANFDALSGGLISMKVCASSCSAVAVIADLANQVQNLSLSKVVSYNKGRLNFGAGDKGAVTVDISELIDDRESEQLSQFVAQASPYNKVMVVGWPIFESDGKTLRSASVEFSPM